MSSTELALHEDGWGSGLPGIGVESTTRGTFAWNFGPTRVAIRGKMKSSGSDGTNKSGFMHVAGNKTHLAYLQEKCVSFAPVSDVSYPRRLRDTPKVPEWPHLEVFYYRRLFEFCLLGVFPGSPGSSGTTTGGLGFPIHRYCISLSLVIVHLFFVLSRTRRTCPAVPT